MVEFYLLALSRFPLLREPDKIFCFDKNRTYDFRTIYDSPSVMELVASTLRSYANSTMRKRGVDITILGVDTAVLGVDIALIGVDIAILEVDTAILRRQEKWRGAAGGGRGRHSGPWYRHSSPRCGYSDPRCRHSNPRCRHSKPEAAREKWRGYWGREEGEVSRVRRLEPGWIARESGGTKSHKGRRASCYKPILRVRSGRGLGCRGTVRRSGQGCWVIS